MASDVTPSRGAPRLVLLSAALPALVLLLSGAAKWLAPGGTLPRALAGRLDAETFAAALKGLGALELLLAVGLCLPATRRAARYGAFLLLGVLAGFVALNAADIAFVQDCGCMGAWKPQGALFGTHVGLLLRNAALAFLVALSTYLDAPRSMRLPAAAAAAGVAAGLLFLGTLYVAERSRVTSAEERLGWHVSGSQRSERLGWALPDLPMRDAAGREIGLLDALKPHDTLLFFSTRCPFCERAAPGWAAEAARLAAAGSRLLLVAVSESGGPAAAFLEQHGARGLPLVVAQDPESLAVLGVAGVPYRIVLDGDGRVAAHEGYGAPVSLLASLATAGEAWPEGLGAFWTALAVRSFGAGAAADGAPLALERGAQVRVAAGGKPLGRLIVLGSTQPAAAALEAAYALDPEGRLVRAELLAVGPFVADLPALRATLAGWAGRTPVEALGLAEQLSRERAEQGPALAAVREQLQRLDRLAGAAASAPEPGAGR